MTFLVDANVLSEKPSHGLRPERQLWSLAMADALQRQA